MITQPLPFAVSVPLATPIAVAIITLFSTWYVQRWRFQREASDQATRVLHQYRDPLLRAAYDLQSRIYNIAAMGYLERYWRDGDPGEKANAITGTLWFFGQYLGWTEILRREIQYLDVGSRLANQRVQGCLNEISAELSTDAHPRGDKLKLTRSDQRAVGDFMIATRATADEGRRPDCLGYAEFIDALSTIDGERAQPNQDGRYSPVSNWRTCFTSDLEHAGSGAAENLPARLFTLQRLLVDLVDLLDADRSRFPHLDYRGKLPLQEHSREPASDEVAQFVWPWSDPWPILDAWAEERHLTPLRRSADVRTYRGRVGPTLRRPEFIVIYRDERVTIRGCSRRGKGHGLINGTMRASRPRRAANALLRKFDRPQIAGGTTVPGRLGALLASSARRIQAGPASAGPS